MKSLLFASLLAAGSLTPAFATDTHVSVIPADSATTVEDALARSRVSIGASRESVIAEMREPNYVFGANVWIYTGFRATNVYGGEGFDTLVVAFKNEKVVSIRLATEAQVRVAAGANAAAKAKVAKL